MIVGDLLGPVVRHIWIGPSRMDDQGHVLRALLRDLGARRVAVYTLPNGLGININGQSTGNRLSRALGGRAVNP